MYKKSIERLNRFEDDREIVTAEDTTDEELTRIAMRTLACCSVLLALWAAGYQAFSNAIDLASIDGVAQMESNPWDGE